MSAHIDVVILVYFGDHGNILGRERVAVGLNGTPPAGTKYVHVYNMVQERIEA